VAGAAASSKSRGGDDGLGDRRAEVASRRRDSDLQDGSLISCECRLPVDVAFIVDPVALTERIVAIGVVIAWRLATSPTSTSPDLENATTEGVYGVLGLG